MTMYIELHSSYDTNRLHVSRKEGEKGFGSNEGCVDASTKRVEE